MYKKLRGESTGAVAAQRCQLALSAALSGHVSKNANSSRFLAVEMRFQGFMNEKC